jgi:uncharacterized protein YjbI with pentapeptide repeats
MTSHFFSGEARADIERECSPGVIVFISRRSVAFGHESDALADLRSTLRSSLDVHYLNAIATRKISGKGRSFKGHSIENYTAKALLLDGSDFSDCTLSHVTLTRSSLSNCTFSGAVLQVSSARYTPATTLLQALIALQRCVIEDLDLSGVKELSSARLANVTFTRVVFKRVALQVSGDCPRSSAREQR